MTRFSIVAAGLWAMILLAPRLAAADAAGPPALRCVAILANDGLAKSGFVDLLGNELQQAGIQLVEREQLGRLVQEQARATAMGSDAAGQRVQLGKLVGADALILLEDEGTKDDRMIRIVIAECRQGARLLTERIRFGTDIAALAQKVRERVVQTRDRFAGGIQGIIAITPFVAKNFTYEYHRLQQGYAVTLREALSGLRGIAVLDVEEAQAIRKELEIAGGNAVGVVPLFVDGEFEVGGEADQPSVRFSIVLRNAAGPRTIVKEKMTLEEASEFLSREMPGEIMPAYREANEIPFTVADEFAKLVARADQFALLGEWRHSADLRQAALGLRPRDVEQRNKLFHDCQAFLESLRTSAHYRTPTPQWEELTRGGAGYYETYLELLEWKIRAYRDHRTGIPIAGAEANYVHFLYGSRAGKLAQPAKRDFLLHVYPVTWDSSWTNATDETKCTHRYYWVDMLVSVVLECNGDPLGREDYELLQQLLDNVVPPGIPPSPRLTGLLWGNTPDSIRARSGREFLDFLSRLKTAKNPIWRLLAREAFLNWQVTRRAPLTPDLLREEGSIRSEYLALNLPKIGGLSAGVIEQLDWLRDQLARPAGPGGRIAATTLPDGIVGAVQSTTHFPGMRDVVFSDEPPAAFAMGALRFENLSFQRKFPNGETIPRKLLQYPPPMNLTQCGDRADILWDTGVSTLRQGAVEPLPLRLTPQSQARDVKWDGTHLWLATAREGLWVMDPDGNVLAKVGESDGLPPFDQGARIFALGPDRLIVAGSFGPTNRAFIAKVEKAGDRYRVNTFFKATRAMTERWMGNDVTDIEISFIPKDMVRCPSPSGGDYLIVRRDFTSQGAMKYPLIIDLKTLSVCVSKTATQQYPFLEVEGGLLQPSSDNGVILWHVTDDGKGLATDYSVLRLPSTRRHPLLGPGNPGWAVGRDGKVYQPGYDWYRIDPKTMTACCLATDGPPAGRYQIAESRAGLVWWGIVGARQYAMYRVSVDEEMVKQLPASALFHAQRVK